MQFGNCSQLIVVINIVVMNYVSYSTAIATDEDIFEALQKVGNSAICGYKLTQVMKFECNEFKKAAFKKKVINQRLLKSQTVPESSTIMVGRLSLLVTPRTTTASKEETNLDVTTSSPRRRRRRGLITDTCCRHVCTLEQLMDFCPPLPKAYRDAAMKELTQAPDMQS